MLGILLVVGIYSSPLGLGAEAARATPTFDGRWEVTRLVLSGTKIPLDDPSGFYLEIDGSSWRYTFVISGKPVCAAFDVSIDRKNSLLQVDAKLLNGVAKGGICRGLLEHNGESMTLCLPDNPSIARPQQLHSNPGDDLHLIEFRRVPIQSDP